MKLRKILLLGLLGLCVPLTGCSDDEKDPASEEVPHHPTSNFDRCPLLAHIDNPKLGIKEITEERYEDGELAYKIVYSYDKEQRLVKITGSDYYETYEYDAKGRLSKYTEMSASGVWGDRYTFFYDDYGFLSKWQGEDLIEETSNGYEAVCVYKYDTVFCNYKDGSEWYVYSEDMYMTTEWHDDYIYYYEWRNGNCLNIKDENGGVRKYTYDDKLNTRRLLNALPIGCTYYDKTENNIIQTQEYGDDNRVVKYEYTYDDNGLVTMMQHGVSKVVYTYIYY